MKMIRAKAGTNDLVNRFNPFPVVTGSTPTHRIDKAAEEKNSRVPKSDRQLLQIYLDNVHWYRSHESRKVNASVMVLGWKLDAMGGLGAVW